MAEFAQEIHGDAMFPAEIEGRGAYGTGAEHAHRFQVMDGNGTTMTRRKP
jgi:hypothetical protein